MPDWKSMLEIATSSNVQTDQISPYIKFLSLPRLSRWKEKTIYIDWHVTPESHQDTGVVFGGYLSALADYAAGSVMLTILDNQDLFFTKKLEVEYKRPVRSGIIIIKAEIIEQFGITAIVRVTFVNEKEDIHVIAHAHQTIFRK